MLRMLCGLIGGMLCLSQWAVAFLQQESPQAPSRPAVDRDEPKDPASLRDDQLAVSGRYARFERMLVQMADVLARQDPERADLLRRAIAQGREETIKEDIEKVVELLNRGDLGSAAEKQSEVISSFQTLLKLLQSEDRRSSVERERERLNSLLKDVNNIISEQKSARAATQNSQAPSNAAPGQQRAMKESDRLLEQMKNHDEEEETREAERNSDSGAGSKDDDKSRSEKSDSPEGKSGDSEKPAPEKSDGQKSDGNPTEGKKSGRNKDQSGSKKAPSTPGREQLEKAREQMEQALKELQEQERESALKDQDEALEELHAAAEELEEKLRQLREEEKEMVLASLEARFQRMLAAETQIHEGTLALAATPQKDWLDASFGRCRELAQQQTELSRECTQTAGLLREDGSAVAMLLAVEDIESDMQSVSEWLQESNVADLTQSVQKDIIESLKQLIETTQKEMQEMKNPERQQSPPGQQQSALVELMAEIRVLRNLQLQVNRRTKQVDDLFRSVPEAEQLPLQRQMRELAQRQQRLIETARELAKQAESQGN